ncbi:MAG: guanylate kinase [Verrucomicrobia bacterium]|nr:guanylate kinase [Verrucomicrobiota bacterium]
MTNQIYFLVGPSGVGKTTVRKHITEKYSNIKFIPSFTTRPPRDNEVDKVDYFFIPKDEFQNLINTNGLIEWEEHFGNYYGISSGFCEEQLQKGYSLIKEIAVGGYKQILNSTNIERSIIKSIFISPDDINELAKRIENRGEANIVDRISSIENELLSASECHHIVKSKTNNLVALFQDIETIIDSYR